MTAETAMVTADRRRNSSRNRKENRKCPRTSSPRLAGSRWAKLSVRWEGLKEKGRQEMISPPNRQYREANTGFISGSTRMITKTRAGNSRIQR